MTEYFRNHFLHVFRRGSSDRRRQLYTHFTTVVVRPADPWSPVTIPNTAQTQDSQETHELIMDGEFRSCALSSYVHV